MPAGTSRFSVLVRRPGGYAGARLCVEEVAISPGRQRLALRVSKRIAIEDADGSDFRWLTSGKYFDSSPVWSPDGKRLAFSRTVGGAGSAVVIADLQTRKLQFATDHEKNNTPLAWSPDGRRLLYETKSPIEDLGEAALFVSQPNGSRRVKIASRAATGSTSWRPR